jgi:DNA transformation protein and related proteins
MAISAEFRGHVLDLLEPLGTITVKAMFGGGGVYLDGVIIGLIAADVLYLKVDDQNRADYEDAGMGPFVPFADKPYPMSYWMVPPDVMEDPDVLGQWARKAWEASRRKGGKKRKRT